MDYIFLVAASLLWLMVEAATAVVVLSPCAVRGGGTRGNSRAFRMQCQRFLLERPENDLACQKGVFMKSWLSLI